MKIRNIKLKNWRNYQNTDIDFSDINVLVGDNASGKTNLLESIYYLASGRSFRAKDENLIKWGGEFLRVNGTIEKEDQKSDVLAVLEKKERLVKTVKIKGQKVPSSHLLGHLNAVLFTPEEIELISTLPEARRRYLNLAISQADRGYAYSLTHYKKTIEHRNSLLKRIFECRAKKDELEVWDGKAAEYGSEIIKKREEYIEKINETIGYHYGQLSGHKDDLRIEYLPSVRGEWANLLLKLAGSREKDILTRVTNVGPHRDDLAFKLNEKNIVEFASRGEFRTAILALKLAEVDYFEANGGEKPILLLDDVFSELDVNRREYLSQVFVNQQTIVTTTDLDHVSKEILAKAKVVEL